MCHMPVNASGIKQQATTGSSSLKASLRTGMGDSIKATIHRFGLCHALPTLRAVLAGRWTNVSTGLPGNGRPVAVVAGMLLRGGNRKVSRTEAILNTAHR